jgi:hypothetical protein
VAVAVGVRVGDGVLPNDCVGEPVCDGVDVGDGSVYVHLKPDVMDVADEKASIVTK